MEENGTKLEGDEQETQVQVRFSTKLKQELRVVNTPFAVPSSLTRYGLSEVINALLGLEKPIPFDFLLDGELIRTSLEILLLAKNLSAETILNIEYIPAVLPPTPRETHVHDDWVSAVDGSLDRFVFTGSYDKFSRVWSSEGTCVKVLEGHSDVITSLCVISSSVSNGENISVITGSKDRTLRMWQLQMEDSSSQKASKPTKCYRGHTSSVQCVAASPSGKQICSGSWDSSIKLWHATEDTLEPEEEEIAKKRKLAGTGVDAQHTETEVTAKASYEGHNQCVSGVAWAADDYLFSVSWDHSVRGWNVETGVNTATMSCSKALHCLSIGGEGAALLATGGADNVLRLWDPRIVGVVAPVLQLTSHKAWITSCKWRQDNTCYLSPDGDIYFVRHIFRTEQFAVCEDGIPFDLVPLLEWHPRSTYHLLSGSHDGTIKLWDMRAKVPLHTLEVHKDKVLCADWWKDDCIVSGGADSKMNVIQNAKFSL